MHDRGEHKYKSRLTLLLHLPTSSLGCPSIYGAGERQDSFNCLFLTERFSRTVSAHFLLLLLYPFTPHMALQSIIDLCGDNSFTDHPVSELTYSVSASSKKRAYMALSQQSRLYGSTAAKTSGRVACGSVPDTVVPPSSRDFISSLCNQSIELDSFLRLQSAQLQSGVEKLRRKHSRDLVTMMEEQATKRLRIKEMELETVTLRNRELEEQVRRMRAESQVWFNYAKTTEAVVCSLRAKLDEVLNQNACPVPDVEEGYGDSGGDSSPTNDTRRDTDAGRRTCGACRENEVSVLLLPCKHLCLCKDCEGRIETCPLCNSTKNASIQVMV